MLNSDELRTLQNIESKYYMIPMIEKINSDISNQKFELQEVFNHLYNYLIDCKNEVEILIQKRIQKCEINNTS